MTMQEHIDHAAAAVRAYRIRKSPEMPLEETDASDLIADLLHLQVSLGFDIELTLDRARMHFDAEQEEEGNQPAGEEQP